MADEGIFATTAEVQRKVGANASAVSNTEAFINQYMTEAESEVNSLTRFNWSDAFSGLDVDVKGILKRAASVRAAMDVINYDDSGFPSIAGMQLRLDKLLNDFNAAIKLLSNQNVQNFINQA